MSTYKFDYYRIKDECRKGFLKDLSRAISVIPVPEVHSILDIGCGTGVPTIWLAEHFAGSITAVDSDGEATGWLEEKIKKSNLNERINVIKRSFLNYDPGEEMFDMVLAEGFLNAVGFEKGFSEIKKFLKRKGYFIIHDELKDNEKKIAFFNRNIFRLLHFFIMDEKAWWDNYYSCLEKETSDPENESLSEFFNSDRQEIAMYRKDPGLFRSVYYVLQKE